MKPLYAALMSGCLATVSLSLLINTAKAQGWDWNGDARWFSDRGCNGSPLFACLTNKQSIEVRPKDIHTGVVVTGMAAGMDTTAYLDVQRRKCSIGWFTRNCKWVKEYSQTIAPRTYHQIPLRGRHDRIIRLTPTSGESRVHLGVSYIPEPGSTNAQMYQQFQLCASNGYDAWQNYSSVGRNLAEARSALQSRLGGSYSVGNSACPSRYP
jgi:hypothetical protein